MRIVAIAVFVMTLLAACGQATSVDEIVEAPPTAEPSSPIATITPTPLMASPTWRPPLQSPTPSATADSGGSDPASTPPPSPTDTPAPPVSPPSPGDECVINPPSNWVLSTIQPGQTIGRLAQCVGASVAELVMVNCLPNGGNLVYAGDPVYTPGVCSPTINPVTPPEPKTDLTPPTPIPPPPSDNGVVTVNVDRASPGQVIEITLAKYVPNGLFIVDIESIDASERLLYCVDQYGDKQIEFTIPENFMLFLSIHVQLSDDEATRINQCGGVLGSAGETSGQLVEPLPIVIPTPTSTATATNEPTVTATATLESTIPPTASPAPAAYP